MNSRFPVEVNGRWSEVEFQFGTAKQASLLTRWRPPPRVRGQAVVRDALEYARLASKRWRYYEKANASAGSLDNLREKVQREPGAEIAMIFTAAATWHSPTAILGFAFVRRSWCNHLIVDFLSVHPRVIARTPEQIRGVGAGILHQLVALAEQLETLCIWGEATAHSAPFYQRILGVEKILDHFFIEDEVMAHCREEWHRKHQQMLARRRPQ